MNFELSISPLGKLHLHALEEGKALDGFTRKLEKAFEGGDAQGLLFLANEGLSEDLPPSLVYWRGVASSYVRELCHTPDWEEHEEELIPIPEDRVLDLWVSQAPTCLGLEYLSQEMMRGIWQRFNVEVRSEFVDFDGEARAFLEMTFPHWHQVGRVTFHLAENKRDVNRPFAFMATYSNRLSNEGTKVQYLPLARALQQYAGTKNRKALVSLLSPVQRAGEKSLVIRELIDSKSIFRPQTWTPQEAHRFLKEIPVFEDSGVLVRVPDWWSRRAPTRLRVQVSLGNKPSGLVGTDALLDFEIGVSLDGGALSDDEWKKISKSTDGLVFLKGKWIEVDSRQLQQALDHWKKVEAAVGNDGVSFLEGMRLLSGLSLDQSSATDEDEETYAWSEVVAGKWLRERLEEIRSPQAVDSAYLDRELLTELRPYQKEGVAWLWLMVRLGLGSCLADDMGLGKTIQVISIFLLIQESRGRKQAPSLLVVPASLVANWKAEMKRFAPTLRAFYAHPSEMPAAELKMMGTQDADHRLGKVDVVVTTYGQVGRLKWLKERQWKMVVLDEAQAIKNPVAQQTKHIKALKAEGSIALSGTPIENKLTDLWSIFDFLNPGLLGNSRQFKLFSKGLDSSDGRAYRGLRNLVKPYLLRRLKTDKSVIQDLPDKVEVRSYCLLSKKQAVLYQQSVADLAEKLEETDGIQRRGLVLSFLMRFKQICNHPSQVFADNVFDPVDSGKFLRLRELGEEIASRQEKVLIFTQFKEMTEPLERHLREVFAVPGLILHGGTAVKKRRVLVDAFQKEDGPPFFVLSLKAGGVGLNLTEACHVIHFDRWWNPAVENQATDRAFRIGQKKNVLVHKFVCRGTIEEKIDELIDKKKELAETVLEGRAEKVLTEMSNEELLNFVSLDINSAMA